MRKRRPGRYRRRPGIAAPLTSVLFMEQTLGGIYAAKLRETEEQLADTTGFCVMVVEKSGTTLKTILVKSDTWSEGKCGRRRCLPCEAVGTSCMTVTARSVRGRGKITPK